MSELEMLVMFFIQIIVGLGILVFINAIIYCIGISIIIALGTIYVFLIDPPIEFCKSLFLRVREFFFQRQHCLIGFKLWFLKKQLNLFIQSIGHGIMIIYLENIFGLRMKDCVLNGIERLEMRYEYSFG